MNCGVCHDVCRCAEAGDGTTSPRVTFHVRWKRPALRPGFGRRLVTTVAWVWLSGFYTGAWAVVDQVPGWVTVATALSTLVLLLVERRWLND